MDINSFIMGKFLRVEWLCRMVAIRLNLKQNNKKPANMFSKVVVYFIFQDGVDEVACFASRSGTISSLPSFHNMAMSSI